LDNLNFDNLVLLEDAFSDVKFFDKGHYYEINGEPALMSVSQIISKYEKPFDKEKIAERFANRNGKNINDVLKEWDWKREYSCHKGSEFHFIVESFFQRKVVPINQKALIGFLKENKIIEESLYVEKYYNEIANFIKNFKNFYDWWKKDHILIKSEFVIGDKKTKLCGMIDNLSYNKKTKELVLFDYKTNKEIKKEGFNGEMLLEPLNNIPKCELGKYSLQLELYKIILERNTPFKIGNAYVVWVAGEKDYELIPTLNVKQEIKYILNNI
jgi:ATP-dependent exoDNAse (exonuclease V) beta subunit